MLVLSRKRDETIFIGENVRIVIVEIRGDKVRLGIEAPKTIPIHRGDVVDRNPELREIHGLEPAA